MRPLEQVNLQYRDGLSRGMRVFTCILAILIFFLLYDFVLECSTGQCGRWWIGRGSDDFYYTRGN